MAYDGTKPEDGGSLSAADIRANFDAIYTLLADLSLTNHGVLVGSGASPISVVTPGSTNQVLKGITGGDPVFGFIGALTEKKVFTSNGTFTRPSNVTHVLVTAVGGGGGGGKGYSSGSGTYWAGSGGGGGEVICKVVDLSSDASVPVTIGAAGSAGTSSHGGSGGNTTFDTHLTAHGGHGGYYSSSAETLGGAGGVKTLISSDTDIVYSIPGGDGGGGGHYKESWMMRAGNLYYFSAGYGGFGGSPAHGFGTGATGGDASGTTGSGYGAGGSGGGANTYTAYNGGAGRAGLLIVRW